MGFKNIRDKAAKLKDNERLNKIWDKAIENATTPRTNRQHVTDAAISVALTVATGGAALPVAIVFAAAEGGARKLWTDSDKAKKIAANRKKKSEERKKGKDGPKPQ